MTMPHEPRGTDFADMLLKHPGKPGQVIIDDVLGQDPLELLASLIPAQGILNVVGNQHFQLIGSGPNMRSLDDQAEFGTNSSRNAIPLVLVGKPHDNIAEVVSLVRMIRRRVGRVVLNGLNVYPDLPPGSRQWNGEASAHRVVSCLGKHPPVAIGFAARRVPARSVHGVSRI